MIYKGVVKGNAIILEEGAHLPNGARVVVTVEPREEQEVGEITSEEREARQALVARMEEFGQRLAGRQVNLSDLILEEREELQNRA